MHRRTIILRPGESITFSCGTTVKADPVLDRECLAIFLEKGLGAAPQYTLKASREPAPDSQQQEAA